MTSEDYNKLFSKLVKKLDIHKKQADSFVLIAKGEMASLKKILSIIEEQKKQKQSKDLLELQSKITHDLSIAKSELYRREALSRLFNILDTSLEESIIETDLFNKLSKSNKYSVDIADRISTGKCAFKRPAKGTKFPCQEPLILGQQYCLRHLKELMPEVYIDLFADKEQNNEN